MRAFAYAKGFSRWYSREGSGLRCLGMGMGEENAQAEGKRSIGEGYARAHVCTKICLRGILANNPTDSSAAFVLVCFRRWHIELLGSAVVVDVALLEKDALSSIARPELEPRSARAARDVAIVADAHLNLWIPCGVLARRSEE